ncbi:hypothetical protein D7X74_20780 [Corallococcus sp. CA047B]|uniref:hypothetical protein n=1 Tax=Corallococcus sp. CA047B TaxID=2316729 RepID=UPI000EA3A898|nr:hypothetical protein [Corallococcus sp. CA047B]RKH14005.1 hypothetical protein D7X74_20780 [Corallococcus sp. CA047B]
MQFTIVDCPPPPTPAEVFLWMMLWSALLVGIPLLRWLMRSPRDGRDILGSAPASPRSFFQGFRDLMGWACLAVLFSGPLLVAMAVVIKADAVFFDHADATLGGSVINLLVDTPFTWGLFAAMTVLGALLRVRWLQGDAPHRDVLNPRTHAA